MARATRWQWKIFLAVLLMEFLAGCEFLQQEFIYNEEILPEPDKSVLIIQLSSGIRSAKTIQPPIVMDIGSFDIYGEGPDPEVDQFQELGNTTGSTRMDDLAPGSWNIRVDARNPDVENDPTRNGTIIGHGETTVEISLGFVTNAVIEITPLSGTGELHLALQWTKGSIPSPGMAATLTPYGSATSIPLTFDGHPPGNPEEFTYSNANLEAGYYTLILHLLSGDTVYWGTLEAVRIVAGEITTQTYILN